jgi:hypothetical protein
MSDDVCNIPGREMTCLRCRQVLRWAWYAPEQLEGVSERSSRRLANVEMENKSGEERAIMLRVLIWRHGPRCTELSELPGNIYTMLDRYHNSPIRRGLCCNPCGVVFVSGKSKNNSVCNFPMTNNRYHLLGH